jgi:hypothetical protein
MYKVITGDGRQYVGFSEKLADAFYRAAADSGRFVLMMVRNGGAWSDVKEHVPTWG